MSSIVLMKTMVGIDDMGIEERVEELFEKNEIWAKQVGRLWARDIGFVRNSVVDTEDIEYRDGSRLAFKTFAKMRIVWRLIDYLRLQSKRFKQGSPVFVHFCALSGAIDPIKDGDDFRDVDARDSLESRCNTLNQQQRSLLRSMLKSKDLKDWAFVNGVSCGRASQVKSKVITKITIGGKKDEC
jgi:hypothetical protein